MFFLLLLICVFIVDYKTYGLTETMRVCCFLLYRLSYPTYALNQSHTSSLRNEPIDFCDCGKDMMVNVSTYFDWFRCFAKVQIYVVYSIVKGFYSIPTKFLIYIISFWILHQFNHKINLRRFHSLYCDNSIILEDNCC